MTESAFLSAHCIESERPAARVAAIVFPELACELARAERGKSSPIDAAPSLDDVPCAIVLAEDTAEAIERGASDCGSSEGGSIQRGSMDRGSVDRGSMDRGGAIAFEAGSALVFAANPSARARGVVSGMRVAEATSRVAGLAIARLAPSAIARTLEGLAESRCISAPRSSSSRPTRSSST